MSESLAYLGQIGFELSGMFPINLDQHHRVIEFDCVAVKAPARPANHS
jgi:hypothetical protein